MTTHLDLTAEQARELRTTGRVGVWRRMEPQPVHRLGRLYDYAGTRGNMLAIAHKHAPHPPGTRARVNEPGWSHGGVAVSVGAILVATLATVRPEQRDGAWGWAEVWEAAK